MMSRPRKRTTREQFITGDIRPCQFCSFKFPRAKALCPRCKQWNNDESITDDDSKLLSEEDDKPFRRILTGIPQVDEIWGGGIVSSSVSLVGGSPGAGKSTLALQLGDVFAGLSIKERRLPPLTTGNLSTEITNPQMVLDAATPREALYIASEETRAQIKERAKRLHVRNLSSIRVVPMGSHADLGSLILKYRPCVTIMDSISAEMDQDAAVQTVKRFKPYADELDAPVIIICHVEKKLDFAGRMALQHAPDGTFTLFAPWEDSEVRELTVVKNRFGPANFCRRLLMTEHGLVPYDGNPDEDE